VSAPPMPEPHALSPAVLAAISAGVRQWLAANNELIFGEIHSAAIDVCHDVITHKQRLDHDSPRH